jgi:hypothetical protein
MIKQLGDRAVIRVNINELLKWQIKDVGLRINKTLNIVKLSFKQQLAYLLAPFKDK